MNWHERIDRAEKRGRFTDEDQKLARDWPTCACGEQDPRIPRRSKTNLYGGAPMDARLCDHGLGFNAAVQNDNFSVARLLLNLIEKRAGEILNEMKEG